MEYINRQCGKKRHGYSMPKLAAHTVTIMLYRVTLVMVTDLNTKGCST